MARTLQEIIDSIFSDKNSKPELNGLNSTSKTAVFTNWTYVAAVAQQNLETIQDRFADEVDETIANSYAGTPQWLALKAKEYQYGYDLTLDANGTKYGYTVVDEASQIIDAVSVSEDSGSTVYLKVATTNATTSELQALTSTQKTAFSKYITKIKFAGMKVSIVSLAADQLVMSGCTVYYDSIYDPTEIKTAVEEALTNYTKSIPFDGKIKTSTVVDIIQGVTGINDVELTHLAIKTGASIVPVDRIAELPAGYINPAESPLDFYTLITYVGV